MSMKKIGSLVLASAALCVALPTAASAHDFHGRGWHGPRSHWHGAAFVPIPVPVPFFRPVYAAPPIYYPRPVYYAPRPAYYAPVPVPFIAVRTPHVAVSIGGWFPY